MAAGLYCITTDFGALFETGAEFPMYIPYSKDYKSLSRKFAHGIEAAAISLEDDTINDHLKFQIDYTNKYYSWDKQAISWNRFLQGALHAKQ